MPSEHCNQLQPTCAAIPRLNVSGVLLIIASGLASLSSCSTQPRSQAVSIHTLENAATVQPGATRRAIVSHAPELGSFYYPLDSRLGLFQIRNAEQWNTLRRCAPELGRCPDLKRGIVIGLASRAGLPLNGTWPIRLETTRVHDGAGLVTAQFNGGSFLPDGTTYVEAAQYDNLRAVLIVEVNGVRFYPE